MNYNHIDSGDLTAALLLATVPFIVCRMTSFARSLITDGVLQRMNLNETMPLCPVNLLRINVSSRNKPKTSKSI